MIVGLTITFRRPPTSWQARCQDAFDKDLKGGLIIAVQWLGPQVMNARASCYEKHGMVRYGEVTTWQRQPPDSRPLTKWEAMLLQEPIRSLEGHPDYGRLFFDDALLTGTSGDDLKVAVDLIVENMPPDGFKSLEM